MVCCWFVGCCKLLLVVVHCCWFVCCCLLLSLLLLLLLLGVVWEAQEGGRMTRRSWRCRNENNNATTQCGGKNLTFKIVRVPIVQVRELVAEQL